MDSQPDSEIVSLAEFDSEQELMVVRALLESEGIECFTLSPLYAASISKRVVERVLTLFVHKGDVAAAHAILDAPIEDQPDAPDEVDS